VKAAADTGGKLTALLQLDVLSNTAPTAITQVPAVSFLRANRSASTTARTRRSTASRPITNTVPAGAFRGYGLPQTLFAVEAAIDELARATRDQPLRDASPQHGEAG